MSGLTRSKIAYDLNLSPHKLKVQYEDTEVLYVFSSQLYRDNFRKKLQENRDRIADSLTKRFSMNIRQDKLADVKLYTSIEKRGFLIFKDGEKIECLSSITLDGHNLTKNN